MTLFTHFVHLANFSDSVPDVNISLSRDSPLYSGTTLNLTCTTTRHCNLNTGEVITATWSGPRDITGERYTISQSTFSRGINISLTISPLTVEDEGVYICNMTVSGESRNQSINASDAVSINVLSKWIIIHICMIYHPLSISM